MRLILTTIVLAGAFGGALVLSGNYGLSRGKAPLPTARQIEVLAETDVVRRVRHPLGETEVPAAPQRIASLCTVATDSLVALGMRPVLVEGAWQSSEPAPYLADQLQGVVSVRRSGTISLEALLDAKPDLILASGAQDSRLFKQLGRIAPTVILNGAGTSNREMALLDVGDVVGKPAMAASRLAAYRRCVADAKRQLSTSSQAQPVAFLRFRQGTCVIYSQSAMFGPLLFEQLGLAPDPAVPDVMSPGGWDVLSVERLSQLRARTIFMVVDKDSESYFDGIARTPLWQGIPAVRHGAVHRVESSIWLGGDGVLANEAIIRDVLTALAPERRH